MVEGRHGDGGIIESVARCPPDGTSGKMEPLSVCQGGHSFTGRVGKPERPYSGILQKTAFALIAYEIGKSHTDLYVVGVGVDDHVPQTIADVAGVGIASHRRSSAPAIPAGQESE
jgi:hypothetical protein